jgi:retron-type reverse transcriptase
VKYDVNQELKLKWHSIYGQILFERKLECAWQRVKENKGAGGIDGTTIKSYEKHLKENIENLLKRLKEKTYRPSPVR